MMSDALSRITNATAIGAGITGGVFFAFSTFIMPALKRLPPEQGIAAMQSINVKAINPLFMLSFFGPAIGSIVLIASARNHTNDASQRYLLAGGMLYLVGTAITLAINVPQNNGLARLDPSAPSSASAWKAYAATWTAANHARDIASIAAATLLSQSNW